MLRTSDSSVLSALDAATIGFTYLVELQFQDGIVYVWAGPQGAVLTYNGHNWVGTGDLGQLREVVETDQLTDERLVGILQASNANLDEIQDVDNAGRKAIFYLLLFDPATGGIIGHIADPREMGASWIEPTVNVDKGSRVIINNLAMEFTTEGTVLDRRHLRRLTHADTLEMDPADFFNEFASDPDLSRKEGELNLRMPGVVGGGSYDYSQYYPPGSSDPIWPGGFGP